MNVARNRFGLFSCARAGVIVRHVPLYVASQFGQRKIALKAVVVLALDSLTLASVAFCTTLLKDFFALQRSLRSVRKPRSREQNEDKPRKFQ
jgi:hypothetical protein